MQKFNMKIIAYKSKPIIILNFHEPIKLNILPDWKKRFKTISETTFHISSTIIEKVFEKNQEILGTWENANFDIAEIEEFYGYTKIDGNVIHSVQFDKRFISDWINEFGKLIRYTVHKETSTAPITAEILYDAGMYSDGKVGNVREEEVDALRKVITPDGDIIMKMKEKLNQEKK